MDSFIRICNSYKILHTYFISMEDFMLVRKENKIIRKEAYRSTSDHEANRACYKLMDALQKWSKKHGGRTGYRAYPKGQLSVYSLEEGRDILIVGVGMDIPTYDDTPLFIDDKGNIHLKDEFRPFDVCKLCESFIYQLERDR